MPRVIRAGKLEGDRLTFTTESQEMLGSADTVRSLTHRYRGTLQGDAILFTLETSGGHSPHPPIQFVARRAQP